MTKDAADVLGPTNDEIDAALPGDPDWWDADRRPAIDLFAFHEREFIVSHDVDEEFYSFPDGVGSESPDMEPVEESEASTYSPQPLEIDSDEVHLAHSDERRFARLRYELVKELHTLLCDEQHNLRERRQFMSDLKAGQTATIAGVATFLSAHLSVPSPFVVPAIVVLMGLASRVGLRAWCSTVTVWLDENKPSAGEE